MSCRGDFNMMVVKNNYFWVIADFRSPVSLLNGDIIEVFEIFFDKGIITVFKCCWGQGENVDCIPNQNLWNPYFIGLLFMAETPSLPYEAGNRLYQGIMKALPMRKSKYKKFFGSKEQLIF